MSLLYFISLFNIMVLLFFYGFFPVSAPKSAQNNDPPTSMNNVNVAEDLYKTNITRTVIIVIDALRLDFVNAEYMPLTSRITNKTGCFNQVKVQLPTVTLPRIKALISGHIPQFIDVVLNLAGTERIHDSLIHSFTKINKKVVFYGDETWLKLFPSHFHRYEGTHSFFVKDFSEVDNNVTRNVNLEIGRDDWHVMILHYLGLDHIGHMYGPFSSLIPKKLQEMDLIIERIYTELSKKYETPLIVLTGDHGMKDSGGHGGSTFAETNVPFLLIGVPCQNGSFEQTDIPVNLAVLHGIQIPSTSLGQIRRNLIPYSLEKYLYMLRYNMLILMQKLTLCNDYFEIATQKHILYLKTEEQLSAYQAAEIYENCTKNIVANLTKTAVEQNILLLKISLVVMAMVISFLCLQLIRKLYPTKLTSQAGSFLSVLFLNFLHPLTFFSTSYIEEEHQFWYFAISFVSVIVCVNDYKIYDLKEILYSLSVAAILRFVRIMNSTGDQWAHLPDFSDWLLEENNQLYYNIFLLVSLISLFLILCYRRNSFAEQTLNLTVIMLIYTFKTSNIIILAKVIWFSITCHFVLFRKTSLITTWCFITALLLKPYNIIIIPCCLLSSLIFRKKFELFSCLIFHLWLGNMLYFAQGHSNSLASVDISVGYTGLNEHNLFIATVQVLCHTYAFPILCHLLAFQAIQKHSTSYETIWHIIFLNRFYVTFVTCLISFLHREHLFIWSVFAPKLFIETLHGCMLFIAFCLYLLHNKIILV